MWSQKTHKKCKQDVEYNYWSLELILHKYKICSIIELSNLAILFITDSTQSLAHACRRCIVIDLALRKRYQENSIRSLPIPALLQDYLLFQDYGPKTSTIIVDSLGYASRDLNIYSKPKVTSSYYEENFEQWNMWTFLHYSRSQQLH